MMIKTQPFVLTTRRQPFRNLACVAILALSCTHAFVLSSRQSVDTATQTTFTTGNLDGQRSTSHSQLNVMQVPPTMETTTRPEEEDDDENNLNGQAKKSFLWNHLSSLRRNNGQARTLSLVQESAMGAPAAYGGRGGSVQLRNGASLQQTTQAEPRRMGAPIELEQEEEPNGKNGYSTSPQPNPEYEKRAEYVAETKLPSEFGKFRMRAYRVPGEPIGKEPCVIYARDKPPMGTASQPSHNVPVRVHDQCLTSEVFGSQRCDCKDQLIMSLEYIKKNGGCVIYLQQEGRGIGLANKIAAYALQDMGLDTVDANLHLGFDEDEREYDIIPSILEDMNIADIQLMTNNPRKVEYLSDLNVRVENTIPMVVPTVNSYNRKYMETKKTRMHHSNFADLLSRNNADETTANGVANGKDQPPMHMMSRRASMPNANDDSVSSLSTETVQEENKFHVSVTVDTVVEENHDDDEEGVVSGEDGYCFGRESVEEAIAAIARGEMVVVVDDMDRENEGDFIMAADQCTPMDMARIIRYSSGVICVALEDDRLEELKLPAMVTQNEDPKGTAFTVTVDATKEHGITTGISAKERATTIQLLANPETRAVDFHRPGHILPLRARPGGVLARDGHTEAAIDLSRLANRQPAGVLCEIVSEENPTEMMRLPEIKRFCKRHGHVLTSIADLAQYRRDMGV